MTEENEELYTQVGKRVREAREAARMTQGELGKRIGLTRASVTNIETARQKVQLQTLYAVADALQVEVPTLLPSSQIVERGASVRLQQVLERTKSVRPTDRAALEALLSVTPQRKRAPKLATVPKRKKTK